jgi:hypothetical protein
MWLVIMLINVKFWILALKCLFTRKYGGEAVKSSIFE